MTSFEYILACAIVPVMYVLVYIAGKHDLLNTIGLMFVSMAKEFEEKVNKLEEERRNKP